MIKAKKKVNGLTWRSLLVQPIVLPIILIVMLTWRNTADLSETERVTLAPAQLQKLTLKHLNLTVVSAVIVLTLAIPIGIILTRKPLRRLSAPVMALANIGQAAPTVDLAVLFVFWLDFGHKAALASLVVCVFPPVPKSMIVGLRAIDPKLVGAARGVGMSGSTTLAKIGLPLAVSVTFAGIRTALVLLVGSATLATFVRNGGLGLLITTGINLSLTRVLVFDSLLVAVLALAVDWTTRVVEFAFYPRGL